MFDNQSMNIPQQTVRAEITLTPFDEEDGDFETLSIVEDVTADVLIETGTMQGYTSKIVGDNSRSAGIILLLGELAHQAIAQKDLIIAFLQAGTAAIGVLAKQRKVSKIEMSMNGDTISIETPDKATVQSLLALFEDKHPGIASKVTPTSKLQVNGKVSKKGRSSNQ